MFVCFKQQQHEARPRGTSPPFRPADPGIVSNRSSPYRSKVSMAAKARPVEFAAATHKRIRVPLFRVAEAGRRV